MSDLQKAKKEYYNVNNQNNALSHNYIKELEKMDQEMLELLMFHMNFKCVAFEDCYNKSYLCEYKPNCRDIETAKLLEKHEGMPIEEMLKYE